MPIAFDSGSSGKTSGASTLTISHTVGAGADRLLLVAAACINGTDFLASATVTYGGVSLGAPKYAVTATANNIVRVWWMVAPATGTANVVITTAAGASVKAFVTSWAGVDQTTPISAAVSSGTGYALSPLTHSIAAASGVAVDFLCNRAASKTMTVGAGQTQIGTALAGFASTSVASYKAGATSMSWTHPDNGNANITYIAMALASSTDSTPPSLTSPTGTATGSTTATGSVSTSEANGTLYRLASTNATETAAAIKAAGLTQGVSATGAQAVTFSGLASGTTYYAHYVHTDAAGNDSAASSSASFTTTVPAATATTLGGPSGGVVGAASSAFTVGANGTITGTVTVTPSDGGDGGTFTPTSVAISSGTPTATFTYTPGSVGAKTISISDTGSLTDATPLTYTATLTAGTLTSSPLKNNTGTVLAAVAFEAYVSNPTSGALVVKKTGLTSNGSGVVSFSDGAVVAATSYRVVWRRTDTGAEGLETLTGT